ncbi:pyridoxal-phosphate dependent enzyme [Aquimarina addita]|uniref:Pyridoxal-phosphate dependent enzyme n=1 Tax=Aquimarina addita TaxID=870485 RepID=A0ABP6UV24_9FLAO
MSLFSSFLAESKNGEITHTILKNASVSLCIKREDLIHREVSGNKFRKLKYNIKEAKKQGFDRILTFGGAYSNHIAATAAAGNIVGLQTIGIIRGDELGNDIAKTLESNDTLRLASDNGMQFKFVTRTQYREKNSQSFLSRLKNEFGSFYCIPEGGTNKLAVRGCGEILTTTDMDFDIICCPVGTGGTIAGIINSSYKNQKILGFPALKGGFLSKEIVQYTKNLNWELIENYNFGGYGKINQELIEFINTFRDEHNIILDPVYTGKMMYGVFDMIRNGYFMKNTRILAIHTGGLQGITGMNRRLLKQKLPLIKI